MEKQFYPAQVEGEAGAYGVWFPDFDGCVGAGETIAEALQDAHDALALHVVGMIDDGERLPRPSEPHLAKGSLAVSMVGVRLPGKRKRVNVSLSEDLLAAIDARTANRSRFLEKAARRELTAA